MTNRDWALLFKICVKISASFCKNRGEFALFNKVLDRTIGWHKFFEFIPEDHFVNDNFNIKSPALPIGISTFYRVKSALKTRRILLFQEDSNILGLNVPRLMGWYLRKIVSSQQLGCHFEEVQNLSRIVLEEFPVDAPKLLENNMKLDEVLEKKEWKAKKKSKLRVTKTKTTPWKEVHAALVSIVENSYLVLHWSEGAFYGVKDVAVMKKMARVLGEHGIDVQTFIKDSVKNHQRIAEFLETIKGTAWSPHHYFVIDIGMHIEDILSYRAAGYPIVEGLTLSLEEGRLDFDREAKRWLKENNMVVALLPRQDRSRRMDEKPDKRESVGPGFSDGIYTVGPMSNPYEIPIKGDN